jgi:hypothetical protein
MSNKGLDMIHTYFGINKDNSKILERQCSEIEFVLRSHGWVHEDDVVEGVKLCQILRWRDYSSWFKHCDMYDKNCDGCSYTRPATVKDLTGG